MTNEELFDDLKQYIDTRMSQQSAQFEQQISGVEQRLITRIDGLDAKLDQVQDAIADTVTQVAEGADVAVQNHEQHYHGRLKHRAA